MDSENYQAMSMVSAEGEEVPLKSCFLRSYEVEELLSQIQDCMVNSLKFHIRNSFMQYEMEEKKDWVTKNYCQVALTVDSIHWTRNAEEYFMYPDAHFVDEENEIGKLNEYCIKIILDLDFSIA
jgi:hypothetical protein